MKTFDYEIPPNLPLLKGGKFPIVGKEGKGAIFYYVIMLMCLLITALYLGSCASLSGIMMFPKLFAAISCGCNLLI